jgi:hypothetical protein
MWVVPRGVLLVMIIPRPCFFIKQGEGFFAFSAIETDEENSLKGVIF